MSISLTGIVRTQAGTTLPNVRVRLRIVQESSSNVVTWTRTLTNFTGNRWQCWDQVLEQGKHLRGIKWEQFKDDCLKFNPSLPTDMPVFKADQQYVLPENPPNVAFDSSVVSDATGCFTFGGLQASDDYELSTEVPGYRPYERKLALDVDNINDILLLPPEQAPMVSNWQGYATASAKIRRLIDQALKMLGNDVVVFDSLPQDLQSLAHGSGYLNDPSSLYYKDICCADLVTICLTAADVDYDWQVTEPPGTQYTSPHTANYYRPSAANPKIREVANNEPWLPGDIIIYGDNPFATDRVKHVNLYVGPFSGTDLSGNPLPAAKNFSVVNASIDYMEHNLEKGSATTPATLDYCLNQRFDYAWWKRVRVLELDRLYNPIPVVDTRGFIQANGSDFTLDGRAFRFIGMNVAGLVHYVGAGNLKGAFPQHRAVQLSAAKQMGSRVVRVFLASRFCDTATVKQRFVETLALAEQFDQYIIPAFIDFYNDSGCNPQGTEIFYQADGQNYTVLNKQFFDSGFRQHYLPFVEAIVTEFHNNKRIFAWEIGNELKVWQNVGGQYQVLAEPLITFYQVVSDRIRQLDKIHLITTGTKSARFSGCNDEQAARLYRLPNLNFLTTHNYEWDNPQEDDAPTAQRVNKPLVVEEAGLEGANRAQRMNAEMDKWFNERGARGFMQWGLMATDGDIGDGDNRCGVDRAIHGSDWQAMVNTYHNRAMQLG